MTDNSVSRTTRGATATSGAVGGGSWETGSDMELTTEAQRDTEKNRGSSLPCRCLYVYWDRGRSGQAFFAHGMSPTAFVRRGKQHVRPRLSRHWPAGLCRPRKTRPRLPCRHRTPPASGTTFPGRFNLCRSSRRHRHRPRRRSCRLRRGGSAPRRFVHSAGRGRRSNTCSGGRRARRSRRSLPRVAGPRRPVLGGPNTLVLVGGSECDSANASGAPG